MHGLSHCIGLPPYFILHGQADEPPRVKRKVLGYFSQVLEGILCIPNALRGLKAQIFHVPDFHATSVATNPFLLLCQQCFPEGAEWGLKRRMLIKKLFEINPENLFVVGAAQGELSYRIGYRIIVSSSSPPQSAVI